VNMSLNKLSALSSLRSVLREMERDIGLQDLSVSEMDVFLAASALTEGPGGVVTSEQIHSHELTSGLAQATYHRALKSLLNLGLLEKAEGYKTSFYVVRSDILSG